MFKTGQNTLNFQHPCETGLNPINKNLSSEKFSDKNLRILNPQIFSENLRNLQKKFLVQLAGQISENFP